MKINMLQEFKQLSGEPIKDGILYTIKDLPTDDPKVEIDWERTKKLDLRGVVCSALQNGKDDANLARTDSIERWKLAVECFENDEVDLKSEQITTIKGLIDKSGWNILVIAQSEGMLEGK